MDFSLHMAPAIDVSKALIVKNTFFDVEVPVAEAPPRRCSSLPRSWMPGESRMGSSSCKSLAGEDPCTASDSETLTPSSDLDSLNGSDKDMLLGASTLSSDSDSDSMECQECDADSMCTTSVSSAAQDEAPSPRPVVEVKLLEFVGDAPVKKAAPVTRTKLRATAQPFASLRAPPAGIQLVIQAAKDALECDPSVAGVQMIQGSMGGTWTMIAHIAKDTLRKNPRYYLAAAKKTLLESAEHSSDTYILGYDVKPFSKIDKCSFSATLASIPDSQQRTACWDSYKCGFCPRRITCRWTHPSETQVMRLVIRVQHHEADEVREPHQEE